MPPFHPHPPPSFGAKCVRDDDCPFKHVVEVSWALHFSFIRLGSESGGAAAAPRCYDAVLLGRGRTGAATACQPHVGAARGAQCVIADLGRACGVARRPPRRGPAAERRGRGFGFGARMGATMPRRMFGWRPSRRPDEGVRPRSQRGPMPTLPDGLGHQAP